MLYYLLFVWFEGFREDLWYLDEADKNCNIRCINIKIILMEKYNYEIYNFCVCNNSNNNNCSLWTLFISCIYAIFKETNTPIYYLNIKTIIVLITEFIAIYSDLYIYWVYSIYYWIFFTHGGGKKQIMHGCTDLYI